MVRTIQEGTIQLSREDVQQRLFRLKDVLPTMTDTGAQKTPGDQIIESSPKARRDGPSAPGRLDLGRFAQFVRGALEQSHHQSYQDGYKILQNGIRSALGFDGVPVGIQVVLRGAYRGADACDKYDDGWEAMYEAMKAVAEDPYSLSDGGFTTFSALMRTNRRITTEKSWQNGYKISKAFIKEVRGNSILFVDPLHRLALGSAMSAADQADKYDDGYKAMVYSCSALAEANSSQRGRGYFQAALAGPSQNMSWQNGYKTLMTFAKNYLNSGEADQFDAVTIRNAIRSADADSQYDSAFRILQGMFRSLM